MILFFKLCGAIAIAAISIGLAAVAVRQFMRMDRKRRVVESEKYKAMIDHTKLTPPQKLFLLSEVVPQLIAYQLAGKASSIRFYSLNESTIVIASFNIALPIIIAAFWPAEAMKGLAMVAVAGAIGFAFTAWDKLEQNSSRWQDYHEIASMIKDSLFELLTETPEIPIEKQFDRFVAEYSEILKLDRNMQRKRVGNAQAAAQETAASIESSIRESRKEYRSEYESTHANAEFTDIVGNDSDGDSTPPVANLRSPQVVSSPEVISQAWGEAAVLRAKFTEEDKAAFMAGDPMAIGGGMAPVGGGGGKSIDGARGMTAAQFVEFSMNDDEDPITQF